MKTRVREIDSERKVQIQREYDRERRKSQKGVNFNYNRVIRFSQFETDKSIRE